ncbi:transglutaminaseTgpA domain-containing protein [Paraconexibacter sp. AEG42_29]
MAQPVRVVAFAFLAVLVGQRWGRLTDGNLGTELLLGAALATAVGMALLGLPQVLGSRRARAATLTVTVLLTFVAALLVSGIDPSLLKPRQWDDLAGGIGNGIGAVPDLRVPYRGDDEWIRSTIGLGGTLLLVLAAVCCFHGRGRPIAATAVLIGTYTLAVIQVEQDRALGDGLMLAALIGLLVLGDRVQLRQARTAGLALAMGIGVAALALPVLNGERPWVDYRSLTEQLGERPTTRFDWSHSYGALPWSRNGRQVLRVRASRPAYWKGVSLDSFDGTRWTRSRNPIAGTTPDERSSTHPGWSLRVSVAVRDMRSTQLYAPGEILEINRSSMKVRPDTPGTVVTARRQMTRGDNYLATVYAPAPTDAELRRAGTDYPYSVTRALTMELPDTTPGSATPRVVPSPQGSTPTPPPSGRRGRRSGLPEGSTGTFGQGFGRTVIAFPAFGSDGSPRAFHRPGGLADDGSAELSSSPYARMWALAQRLRATSTSPYDYILKVQERLRDGASYDERPPAARYPLESFVFDSRRGYCQQFSGSMALLLRMGGVPARVAEGFAPGTLDTARGEWVVRDSDAHSWVEVYMPGIGWTVIDPTPAVAPAASQVETQLEEDDAAAATPGDDRSDSSGAGDTAGLTPISGSGDSDGGSVVPWLIGGLLLAAVAAAATAAWVRARRRAARPGADPALDELLRALSRAGRPVPPGGTLSKVAASFVMAPEAGAYVRALARARYDTSGAPAPFHPDRAARRALRRGLTGGGLAGRLRGLYALPPRLPRRAR